MNPLSEACIGKHIGTFSVSREILEKYPQEILDFFHAQGLLIVKAEAEFCSDSVFYVAYSETFEPVPFGRIPYYYLFKTDMEMTEAGPSVKRFYLERLN